MWSGEIITGTNMNPGLKHEGQTVHSVGKVGTIQDMYE